MIYRRFIFVQVAAPGLATGASDELYRAYVSFEKQHGDRDAIEEVGWSHFTIVFFVVLSDGQPYGRWSSTRDASSMRNKRVVIADSVPLVSDVEIEI